MAEDTITIRHISDDGWEVVIVEDGSTTSRDFENGGYALSYAEGQSVRLGVEVTHERDGFPGGIV